MVLLALSVKKTVLRLRPYFLSKKTNWWLSLCVPFQFALGLIIRRILSGIMKNLNRVLSSDLLLPLGKA